MPLGPEPGEFVMPVQNSGLAWLLLADIVNGRLVRLQQFSCRSPGGIVQHQAGMEASEQAVEISHAAKVFHNIAVITDVIAVVFIRGTVNWVKPTALMPRLLM